MRSRGKEFQEMLNLYHTYLQFNPPYPVLVDASFICSIIANKVNNINEFLSERYNRKFKFFATRCVLHHLKRQFPNNGQLEEIMSKLLTYPCSHLHSAHTSTFLCIYGIAGQNQFKKSIGPPRCKRYAQVEEPRVIVATQNLNLVEVLREVIAVPLMYFNNGEVTIERPSEITLKMIETTMQRKQEMIGMEIEILAHAVEDEGIEAEKKKRKQAKESWDTGGNFGESSKCIKRKREVSPDICDISGRSRKKKAVEFDMYKALCREKDEISDRNQQIQTKQLGQPRSITNVAYPTTSSFLLTNTSSFEFDTNNDNRT